jgi:hypothetical protein
MEDVVSVAASHAESKQGGTHNQLPKGYECPNGLSN